MHLGLRRKPYLLLEKHQSGFRLTQRKRGTVLQATARRPNFFHLVFAKHRYKLNSSQRTLC